MKRLCFTLVFLAVLLLNACTTQENITPQQESEQRLDGHGLGDLCYPDEECSIYCTENEAQGSACLNFCKENNEYGEYPFCDAL